MQEPSSTCSHELPTVHSKATLLPQVHPLGDTLLSTEFAHALWPWDPVLIWWYVHCIQNMRIFPVLMLGPPWRDHDPDREAEDWNSSEGTEKKADL